VLAKAPSVERDSPYARLWERFASRGGETIGPAEAPLSRRERIDVTAARKKTTTGWPGSLASWAPSDVARKRSVPIATLCLASSLCVVGQTSSNTPADPAQVLQRLAREGLVRLPTHRLDEFLAVRGPLRGPVTDAGTRALQQQRCERA
jgi:hypothetical protein